MRLKIVFGLLVSVSLFGSTQQIRTLTIRVDDPRPLATVVRQLESRHGWIITYEDVAYVHPEALQDVTASVRKDPMPTSARTIVPRGGPFEFNYTEPLATGAEPAATVLSLLAQYRNSSHPGVFRMVPDGRRTHIVPSERRTALGMLEAKGSVLNTLITIPAGERNALELLELIRDELTQRTGTKVLIGIVPLNLLSRTMVDGNARAESARSVLQRVLDATGWPLSWQIFYQAGPTPLYGLNIHAVGRPQDGRE